jgi:hypothetical protein
LRAHENKTFDQLTDLGSLQDTLRSRVEAGEAERRQIGLKLDSFSEKIRLFGEEVAGLKDGLRRQIEDAQLELKREFIAF